MTLYYIILYYITLYYIILYYIILYYIISYYNILYCIVLYCIVLYCIILSAGPFRGHQAARCRMQVYKSRVYVLPVCIAVLQLVSGFLSLSPSVELML